MPVKLILASVMFLLLHVSVASLAGEISRDARKYMARGQAAMEDAKTKADFQDAVKQFRKVTQYAPNWSDAWYNLGIAQRSAKDYQAAIVSLSKYLKLKPSAPDKIEIEGQIFKLEYLQEKAAKSSTPIAEQSVSSLSLAGRWYIRYNYGKYTNESTYDLIPLGPHKFKLKFIRTITIPADGGVHGRREMYVTASINGFRVNGKYYNRTLDHLRCEDPGFSLAISGFISKDRSKITIITPPASLFSIATCKYMDSDGSTLTFER